MMRRMAVLGLLITSAAWPATSQSPAAVRICRSIEEAVAPAGSPVLLVFFAIDCAVCYNDLFEARYAVERGGWPVAVVGVFSGREDDLRVFLEKYAWTLPVVLDRRKALARKYKVDLAPAKVLVVGGETVYRDDPHAGFERRWDELKSCARKIFSR